MQLSKAPSPPFVAAGYRLEISTRGSISSARILARSGIVAASGFAAETNETFIYDRINTAPEHRRKGLARAVMTALRGAKKAELTPEYLVATEQGRALYESLDWQVLSTYFTASLQG